MTLAARYLWDVRRCLSVRLTLVIVVGLLCVVCVYLTVGRLFLAHFRTGLTEGLFFTYVFCLFGIIGANIAAMIWYAYLTQHRAQDLAKKTLNAKIQHLKGK